MSEDIQFKNSKPLPKAESNWTNVDNFLHTWGFLPNDHQSIQLMKKEDQEYLILLLLDLAWRDPSPQESARAIGIIQQKLVEIDEYSNILAYFKNHE